MVHVSDNRLDCFRPQRFVTLLGMNETLSTSQLGVPQRTPQSSHTCTSTGCRPPIDNFIPIASRLFYHLYLPTNQPTHHKNIKMSTLSTSENSIMSTPQPQPPKSILKKTSSHTTILTSDPSDPSDPLDLETLKIKPKSDAERKRLDTAIQHAHLIHTQKQIINLNLDAIEQLSDYPASSAATSSETSHFLTAMVDFQPSDYDALIEERHVNGRCGYTLCPNPPRKPGPKAPWLKNKVENWCSDDCAKKALYIKAQLSETPAWERRAGDRTPLVLYGGASAATAAKPTSSSTQATLPLRQKPNSTTNDHRDLAYERGEVDKVADGKMDKVIKAEVQENTTISSVMPPTKTRFADSDVHDLIEGYQPRGVQKGNRITIKSEDSDSDDAEDEE
jgi:hypothetical protein